MNTRCFKKRNNLLSSFIVLIICTYITIIIFLHHEDTDLKTLVFKRYHRSQFNFIHLKYIHHLESHKDIQNYRQKRFEFFQNSTSIGLGEGGNSSYVKDVDPELIRKEFNKEMFNKLLSDRISLDRSLPDYRIDECKLLKYPHDLPRASVVIVFCNEAPSVVLRTVHSVINRTPPIYLHEVILVDDASDREDLKSELPDHLRTVYPDGITKLIVSDKRLGLIKARMIGASVAKGEVLVFLDSHCEVTYMWMEPLLYRIKENRRTVVCPLIDLLCTQTLGYSRNGGESAGGFGWNLIFDWMPIQVKENMKRKNMTYPLRSPAMAGGLFAVDRHFFFELGGYDEGMEIWGGENIEMSLRTWMCGGSLEFIPCSRVGHLYRTAFPYSTDGKNLNINLKRLAEVWLDDYKRIFYLYRPDLMSLNVGKLGDRIDLRIKLKCHSFKWYLKNVFPELFVPDENVRAHGNLCLRSKNKCWDSMGRDSGYSSYAISLFDNQEGLSLNQYFAWDKEFKIRKDNRCFIIVYRKEKSEIMMEKCAVNNGIQVSYIKDSGLIMLENGQCIEAMFDENRNYGKLVIKACNSSKENQRWKFQYLAD